MKDIINRIFREGLAPLMEPLGYELGKNGWTLRRFCRPRNRPRKEAETVFLIELIQDESHFTVELGVHYPAIADLLLKLPAYAKLRSHLTPPDLPACPLRVQLGNLWKGRDHVWKMSADCNVKATIEELTVVVIEVGLPWLMARQSWQFLLDGDARDDAVLAAWMLADPVKLQEKLESRLSTEKDGTLKAQLRLWL